MWCKKCWRYLECAIIEIQKGKKQTFGTITDAPGVGSASEEAQRITTAKEEAKLKEGMQIKSNDPLDLLKTFYIFPNEYLSLILNAKQRFKDMKSCYSPGENI